MAGINEFYMTSQARVEGEKGEGRLSFLSVLVPPWGGGTEKKGKKRIISSKRGKKERGGRQLNVPAVREEGRELKAPVPVLEGRGKGWVSCFLPPPWGKEKCKEPGLVKKRRGGGQIPNPNRIVFGGKRKREVARSKLGLICLEETAIPLISVAEKIVVHTPSLLCIRTPVGGGREPHRVANSSHHLPF